MQNISLDDRINIARVCNVIEALANQKVTIDETMIVYALECAGNRSPKDILSQSVQREIAQYSLERCNEMLS
jgi:hypothetical protein